MVPRFSRSCRRKPRHRNTVITSELRGSRRSADACVSKDRGGIFTSGEWCQCKQRSRSPNPSSLNHFLIGFLPARVLTSRVVWPSTSLFSSTSNFMTPSKSSPVRTSNVTARSTARWRGDAGSSPLDGDTRFTGCFPHRSSHSMRNVSSHSGEMPRFSVDVVGAQLPEVILTRDRGPSDGGVPRFPRCLALTRTITNSFASCCL